MPIYHTIVDMCHPLGLLLHCSRILFHHCIKGEWGAAYDILTNCRSNSIYSARDNNFIAASKYSGMKHVSSYSSLSMLWANWTYNLCRMFWDKSSLSVILSYLLFINWCLDIWSIQEYIIWSRDQILIEILKKIKPKILQSNSTKCERKTER